MGKVLSHLAVIIVSIFEKWHSHGSSGVINTLTWASAICSFLTMRAVVGLEMRDEQVQLPASFLFKYNNVSESGVVIGKGSCMRKCIICKVYQLTASWKVYEHDQDNTAKTVEGKTLKDRIHLFVDDYTKSEFIELAFFDGKDFKEIFKQKNADFGSGLAVVKIVNPATGRCIRRLFRSSQGFHGIPAVDEYVGLSYSSLLALCKSQESFKEMDQLLVTKGSAILYYLNHPNHCTKIMIWLAIISILFGIVGLLDVFGLLNQLKSIL